MSFYLFKKRDILNLKSEMCNVHEDGVDILKFNLNY